MIEDADPASRWQEIVRDPMKLVGLFLQALEDLSVGRKTLDLLVTPESVDQWGDFELASELVGAIASLGYPAKARPALGDDRVCYIPLVEGVPADGFQIEGDGAVLTAAQIITLVWRPDFGRWMVHHLGDYVLPENIPHGHG